MALRRARNLLYLPPGDFTATTVMPLDPVTPATTSWFWIAGIDVLTPQRSGAIAALGDSITNGVGSSPDANHLIDFDSVLRDPADPAQILARYE